METNALELASHADEDSRLSPPCTECASAETEPVATMMHHTADAGQWYHCEECGHFFATSDDNE